MQFLQLLQIKFTLWVNLQSWLDITFQIIVFVVHFDDKSQYYINSK